MTLIACAHCGGHVRAHRTTATYCSGACRAAASRARHHAAVDALRAQLERLQGRTAA